MPKKLFKNGSSFSTTVASSWDILHNMEIMLIRIAILLVIFLGGLFTILAIAGKEWRQLKRSEGTATESLWETCVDIDTIVTINTCQTIKTSDLEKNNVKG